jgi:hypothetical protein
VTAADVLRVASDAGMTFTVDGSKLRVRGGSPQSRAEFAPVIAPHAIAIAILIRECTLGRGDPAPCPSCGYIHGTLIPRHPCAGCGRTDLTVMVVADDGDRHCPRCLTGGTDAT